MSYCGLKDTGTSIIQTINRCIHGTTSTMAIKTLSTKEELSKSSLYGKPKKSLISPGKCQYTQDFIKSKLLCKWQVSQTSSILRFELPNVNKPLDLSTCACILAKASLLSNGDDGGKKEEDVIRPYTPISTNELIGSFDLLVKDYPEGKMSHHLNTMAIGSTIEFKHIPFNVKIQAPFKYKKIGMIVGGTGITPMIQALHAILGDNENKIHVTMLYGSRTQNDILGYELLKSWEDDYKDSLKVVHVLSHEKDEQKNYNYEYGFITKDMITKYLPKSNEGDDISIFICGPPIMYDIMCGPRNEDDVKGYLSDLGFDKDQVYKF